MDSTIVVTLVLTALFVAAIVYVSVRSRREELREKPEQPADSAKQGKAQ